MKLKLIIKIFLLAIILAVYTYLISVFLTAEWNAIRWHLWFRFIIAILYLFALAFLSLFIIEEEKE